MAKETTYSGVLGDLRRLQKAMAANGADLAHLEGPRAKFDEALDQVQEIVNHQAALTASKQEASRRRAVVPRDTPSERTTSRRLLRYGVVYSDTPLSADDGTLGKRAVTPDTALRLARYFRTSERFWLGLQLDFDLEEAKRELSEVIHREISPALPAA